ncbi:MAG: 50S ribosomal protein L25 [Thermodesulfobacterium geofontis]|uniref:Large ribosomal subunit protein bL25 n=1 Tax=Thermodesulfobacterium geofontis TaxID=1295609 RepID=A0A2N7PMW4_9BACT|nr:MAG: 50S ribosomal protein L25 [Thermodesulfobacterium geofontis]
MKQVTLSAIKREKTGKEFCKKLRKQGLIPAIVYGSRFQPLPIAIKSSELESILIKHKGETILFNLQLINGESSKIQAILKEYQIHPITDKIIHIDFVAIHEKETIIIDVPLEFLGKPIGISKGGILEILLHELTVECLPSDIPDKIAIDISNLDIGDVLHVKDIKVPEGIKIVDDPEETVATVLVEAKEEVEETVEEVPEKSTE